MAVHHKLDVTYSVSGKTHAPSDDSQLLPVKVIGNLHSKTGINITDAVIYILLAILSIVLRIQ